MKTNESKSPRKPLTHTRQAEAAKAESKPYKLNAGEGLFLEVMPNGSKRWRLRYFFQSKEKMLSLGIFPAIGLQDARDRRDDAKRLLARGTDPSEKRRDDRAATLLAAENTFEAIAREWMERHPPGAESTMKKTKWLLQFAFDEFGRRPITAVTPMMVLAACRKQEDQGKLETAQRIKVKCSQVCRYAVATGRLERDPTTDLRGALRTPEVVHHAAITDPAKLGELLRDIDSYPGYYTTQCALKLAPLVFIRPGELRSARWADIDLNAGEWRFTPPKTRNQTGLKLIVPLSRQALQILKDLYPYTGASPYVFPNMTTFKSCMSENTVNAALRRMGYTSDEICCHGLRATARTILDEGLSFPADHIEQQLGHAVKDANGRAYNRTRHLRQRKKMMQRWADYLDHLKRGAEIVQFPRAVA